MSVAEGRFGRGLGLRIPGWIRVAMSLLLIGTGAIIFAGSSWGNSQEGSQDPSTNKETTSDCEKYIKTPAGKGKLCCKASDGTATPYDPKTQGCCNGKVYDLAKEGCCYNEVYDLKKKGCCKRSDGTVIGVYDLETECCCSEKIVKKPKGAKCP